MDFASRKLKCGGKLILLRLPDGTRLQIAHLSYKDYLIFESLYRTSSHSFTIDNLVAQTVVQDDMFFDPSWLAQQRAGICYTIANLVMYLSGNHYGSDDQTLEQMINVARGDAATLDNTMFSTICRVFPSYKFHDLEQMTFPEILRLFACAERALIETGVIESPFELTRSNEQPVQKQKKGTMVVPSSQIAQSNAEWGSMDNAYDIAQHDAQINSAPEKEYRIDSPDAREAVKRYNTSTAITRKATKRKAAPGKF